MITSVEMSGNLKTVMSYSINRCKQATKIR